MLLESEVGQKAIAPVEDVKEVKGSAKEVNYFNNEEL